MGTLPSDYPVVSFSHGLCKVANNMSIVWMNGRLLTLYDNFYVQKHNTDTTIFFFPIHFPQIYHQGGNLLIYSFICSQLASHGLIVFAIEHRDGSGSLVLVLGANREWIQFKRTYRENWGLFFRIKLRFELQKCKFA
jgi:hypothetical protein